jgi:hypothetical protein
MLLLPNGESLKSVAQKLVNEGIQRKNDFDPQWMQWIT